MAFEPRDKVVLITGASSGIGRETAKAFGRAGAKVALTGRDAKALETAAQEIRAAGGNAEHFVCDLEKIELIPRLAADVRQKLGAIDVLINNAGYAVTGLVEDCPVDQFRKNFEVNFFAPIALIQAVVPDMKKKGEGQIINVSSGVGRRALPGVGSYCSTKFALCGLTESLRLELKPFNIDVIAIFPGRVESNFHERIESYGALKRKLPPIPMRKPDVIGEFILKASRARKREATVWGPGMIGYHLNYWAPALVDRLLMKRFPVR